MHKYYSNVSIASSPIVRAFFFLCGCLFIGLGVIGIVLPGLPTTPFMLLAAGCFAKSSAKFHHWLITHKTFGKFIVDWQERRVIPKRAKWLSWTMMTISCAMMFWRFWGEPLLIWIAVISTIICVATAVWMAKLPDT